MKRLMTLFVGLILLPTMAIAATIQVPANQPTIQAGINAAVNGDTVLVAPGTYVGDGNRDLDFGGKQLILKSEDGPDSTVIDCQGSESNPHRAFYFHSGEDSSATVSGFRILHGYALDKGGGMLCLDASPTIVNCVFESNECQIPSDYSIGHGAGAYFANSTSLIADCLFSGNLANQGAGLMAEESASLTITNCDFVEDTAAYGGGALICRGTCVMRSCLIRDCASHFDVCVSIGGGSVENCVFTGNWDWGLLSVTNGTVSHCLMYDNTLRGNFLVVAGNSIVRSCTVANNHNAGPYGSVIFVYYGSYVLLENSIIAFNYVATTFECLTNATTTAYCCNIFGNSSGDWMGCGAGQGGIYGNFSANPLFCDEPSGNYGLLPSSPCGFSYTSCHLTIGAIESGCSRAKPGDADGSGSIDISDAVYLVQYIFANGIPPVSIEAGDANCDHAVDISDAVYLIGYIFSGGSAPCVPSEGSSTGANQ
jgi:hypothetical protein